MKESNLIEMRNKIEILGAQYQNILQEFTILKNQFLGSIEVMKKLPGYKEVIEELTKKELELQAKEKSALENLKNKKDNELEK
tara:strand:+ start:2644 stop:2892 length:249 start_codon:yes stop_codon:yes gene_type:complete